MYLNFIKKKIPIFLKNIINRILSIFTWKPYQVIIFSQGGEDLILEGIFGNKKKGFWVDIGAHHPQRFSNTYKFYLKGWNGINIDALPGSMTIFNKLRPYDINLEIPIFNEKKSLTYYQFKEAALNGFSTDISLERNLKSNDLIINQIEMVGYPLKDVLNKYLPANITEIDFFSIDVEGFDLNVLESNDWNKYRPKIVVVEILDKPIYELDNNMILIFMKSKGYQLYAKTTQSAFFISDEFHAKRNSSLK
jgi:hypothetical protein